MKARHTRLRSDAPPGTVGEFTGEVVKVASGGEWVLVTRLRVDKETMHPAKVLKGGEQLTSC